MSHSVLAKSAEMAWGLLESYNIDPLPLFRDSRIDPKLMSDMSARFSQSTMDGLWRNIAKTVDDPCFGLRLGKLWHPSYMHALGYAWLSSSTLRTALERLARYSQVVEQDREIKLDDRDDQFSIMSARATRKKDDYWYADGVMALIISMCRANYGDSLDPITVTFRHEKPTCASDFKELFRCPVEFGAKHDRLVLSRKDVDKRLPGSNPMLAQLHDQVMIKYLAKLDEDDIVQRVKITIIEQLPDGRMSDMKVADALFMNNRKLQRKLQEKGTTFKTILTDVRKELALKYIQGRQMNLTELSFQLGFSEMSAFSRAFKQWTGHSPTEYQKLM